MNVFEMKKAQADRMKGGLREHQPGFLVESMSARSTQEEPPQEPGPQGTRFHLLFPSQPAVHGKAHHGALARILTCASDPLPL